MVVVGLCCKTFDPEVSFCPLESPFKSYHLTCKKCYPLISICHRICTFFYLWIFLYFFFFFLHPMPCLVGAVDYLILVGAWVISPWIHHFGVFCFLPKLGRKWGRKRALDGNLPICPSPPSTLIFSSSSSFFFPCKLLIFFNIIGA